MLNEVKHLGSEGEVGVAGQTICGAAPGSHSALPGRQHGEDTKELQITA